MVGMSLVFESDRLVHVDFLVEGTIEEGCCDIELVEFQIVRSHDGEDYTDAIHAYDGRVCFKEIDAGSLCVALGHKASFVPGDGAINMEFQLIRPFAVDQCVTFR